MTRRGFAFVVLLLVALAGSAAAQDLAKYHNYAEMSARLKGLAAVNKSFVKIESIGQTLEKRDLWMLEIANPGIVPAGERPGLLIAANFEGDHVYGGEIAMFIADHLVKNAAKPEVKKALDSVVFYILPRANPDGAEAMWAPVKWARRTNTRPFDDDNDARTDEDGPDDLNKDGFITVMRVPDPNGAYIIDPDEKRSMRRADPKKGEKGGFALYWEGIDNDGDGFINEDPPGGVNINRNFMHEYPSYKAEAGRYMVSEAETRSLLAWIVKHRNVAAILTFGESDNLITPPNASGQLASARTLDLFSFADATNAGANKTGMYAGGLAAMFGRGGRGGGGGEMMISEEMIQMLMASGGAEMLMGGQRGAGGQRGTAAPAAAQQPAGRAAMPARTAATTFNTADLDYFRMIGQKYAELTGLRTAPLLIKAEGAFFQYGYFQFGVPSFSTPGWGLPDAPRGAGQGMMGGGGPGGQPPAASGQAGGQPSAAQMQQFAALMGQRGGAVTARGGGGAAELPTGIDKQVLQWMDKEKIDGFVAWTKANHPELGDVEIGGFKPYAAVDPPAPKIAELGKGQAEFALYLTTLFPKIQVAKMEAENHGGGIFRIKAEVANEGFLPTALAQAVTARAVKPTMVQLQVPPESIISGNGKTNFIQALNGSGDRQKFEWLIKAKAGATVALKVVSQKGGSDTASVVLK